ncbi:Retrotransposon-derived protein PEG10 [Smittium culicis]|uniref:Retrotransposon-derived protein PEG10 n=1 Tax=Smittium culicis TaxID=133412 RepID=A0A1R1YHA9_9FUNG|nr:Retrotransposon-derived protein PEG10 [Smittium culicis]
MSIFFYSSPELFAEDKSKILYIGTHLLGTASDWFGTLVLQQAPCLQNYEAFITEFGNNFSDPSHSIKVRGLIRKCKQGPRFVIAFATEFRSLARDSGFDNTALVDQFLRGLSPKIMQYLMVTDLPDSLEDTIKISVRVDNRIYTVDQINGDQMFERSRNPFARQAPVNHPTSEESSHPGKTIYMEIDALTSKPRVPLTEKEKTRRYELGLCLYCGGNGHIA